VDFVSIAEISAVGTTIITLIEIHYFLGNHEGIYSV